MPAKKDSPKMDMGKLIDRFRGEERCRDYLVELRWPEGVRCPRCESDKISRIHDRGQFDCDSCRYQFSVRVGTVLQDSKLPLWKWFMAAFLMVESKKGISSKQLERMLGVSYKTAWFLTHRIRAAMQFARVERLQGTVEVDETWVGGKVRGKGRGYRGNKSMVLGVVARGGEVRLRVDKRADAPTLRRFIREHVADDAEAIFTDDWAAYEGSGDDNTRHETVNHSEEEWVRGEVHTNTVESVWSLLKRSIIGSYHQLSAKHLDAYLDEMEWRFNNRENPYIFEDTLRAIVSSENLEYKDLTA